MGSFSPSVLDTNPSSSHQNAELSAVSARKMVILCGISHCTLQIITPTHTIVYYCLQSDWHKTWHIFRPINLSVSHKIVVELICISCVCVCIGAISRIPCHFRLHRTSHSANRLLAMLCCMYIMCALFAFPPHPTKICASESKQINGELCKRLGTYSMSRFCSLRQPKPPIVIASH